MGDTHKEGVGKKKRREGGKKGRSVGPLPPPPLVVVWVWDIPPPPTSHPHPPPSLLTGAWAWDPPPSSPRPLSSPPPLLTGAWAWDPGVQGTSWQMGRGVRSVRAKSIIQIPYFSHARPTGTAAEKCKRGQKRIIIAKIIRRDQICGKHFSKAHEAFWFISLGLCFRNAAPLAHAYFLWHP